MQHGVELRPQRVEVVPAHVGAVAAVADLVLPVQAHEPRLVVEPGPQPILQPRRHLPGAFLLSLFELGLGEEREGRRVAVDAEQMVQVGASFPPDVGQLDDLVDPAGFLYGGGIHRSLCVDYDSHS